MILAGRGVSVTTGREKLAAMMTDTGFDLLLNARSDCPRASVEWRHGALTLCGLILDAFIARVFAEVIDRILRFCI